MLEEIHRKVTGKEKISFRKHASKLECYPNFLHRNSVETPSCNVIIANTTQQDGLGISSLKDGWSPFQEDRHGTIRTHLLCQ